MALCTLRPNSVLRLIGGGGFGSVYKEETTGYAVKALFNANECDKAEEELLIQKKIYDGFKKLKEFKENALTIDRDQTLQDVDSYVTISKPINSCPQKIIIDHVSYLCYFFMTMLNGVDTNHLLDRDPQLYDQAEPDYRPRDIQVHTSFNLETPERLYGRKFSKTKVGRNNPSRGYFLNNQSNLDGLHLPFDKERIMKMMGFVYAFIFFYLKIIPKDIEFTLGTVDGEPAINVLDFGMAIDLTKQNPDLKEFGFLSSVPTNVETLGDFAQYEKKIVEELSIDIYCDFDDEECMLGWNSGKRAAFKMLE